MDSRRSGRYDIAHPLTSLSPTIAALLLSTLAGLLCVASGPALGASSPLEFHIGAGEATVTLNEFSRQANLQLLFDFRIVQGRRTQAVDGNFEPQDALRHMLADTGLDFAFVNTRTLAVTPLKVASAAGSARPPLPQIAGRLPHSTNTQSVADSPGSAEPAPEGFNPIDTVKITGTYLRGESPVGGNVISIGREEIDSSGAATAGQFLQTLSQVFGGGPTQDTHRVGAEAQTNSGYGTGTNLRGLGARATLVLINGRRLAPGGNEAAFVDTENIPLSAIERVEVLPDSASALYGADAVGGVVNFIMRDKFVGSETQLSTGVGTQSSLRNEQFSQTLGRKWQNANAMVSFEYYRREALPAAARKYAVSDLAPFGGANFDTPTSNPGTLLVGAETYALPKGQDGTHLSLASLTPGTQNLHDLYSDAEILPQQQRFSLYGSARKSFADRLNVFTSLLLTDREARQRGGGLGAGFPVPASNPFNPAAGVPGAVSVYYNFANDLGPTTTDVTVKTANAAAGFDFDAGASWLLHGYGGYARERQLQGVRGLVDIAAVEAALADPDPATAFNPFGDGSNTNPQTLRSFAAGTTFRLESQLEMAGFSADGALWKLPGGELKMAAGFDRRNQFFGTVNPPSPFGGPASTNLSRHTTAAFTELILPLFGKDNARTGLKKLDLSAAARYEDYAGFGHATTPKFGFAWSPLDSLAFRGTWSRSLRAPTLADLDESQNTVVPVPLADPKAPGGQSLALVWQGKNAALREERARSWTAGFDFNPAAAPEWSLGLTLFDIDFNNRIEAASFSPDVLGNPRFASLVIRNPDPSLVNYVCSHSLNFVTTAEGCTQLGPQAIVDLRSHNVEALRTRGIDFSTQFQRALGRGRLQLRLDGTYLLKYSLAESDGDPAASLLNTQNNPINLRFRGAATWTGQRFGWMGAVNYANSYRDTATQPNLPVSAWITFDAQLRYELGRDEGGWLQGTRLEFNAVNLFNRDPPFLNNALVGLGYDQENADPYGRLVSLRIRKNW